MASCDHVVIIGGGLVGLSFALTFLHYMQQNGKQIRITLVECGSSFSQNFDDPDRYPLTTALSYGSSMIYRFLDVWDALRLEVEPIQHICVSERHRLGKVHFWAHEEKVPALGYVISNDKLQQCLWKRLTQYRDVTVYHPAEVVQLETKPNHVWIKIAQDHNVHELTADLIVLAGGIHSPLIKKIGFNVCVKPYNQTAILATVTHEYAHQGTAFERFTEEGPIAMLPIKNELKHKSTVVWTMPDAVAKVRASLSSEACLSILQRRFGHGLGVLTHLGHRQTHSLALKWVSEPACSGVVLLGNAAHSLHPVAGQGYNLALRDIMTLATLLAQAPVPHSLGKFSLLKHYLDGQYADQTSTIMLSDLLISLFSSQDLWRRLGRSAGLTLLQHCPVMKHWACRKAMGLGGYGV